MSLHRHAIQCLKSDEPNQFITFCWELGLYALSISEEINDSLVSQISLVMKSPQFLQNEASSELIAQLNEYWHNLSGQQKKELLTTAAHCVPNIASKRAAFMIIVLLGLTDRSTHAFELIETLSQIESPNASTVISGLGFFLGQAENHDTADRALARLQSISQEHESNSIRALATEVMVNCRNRTGLFRPNINWRDL